MVPGPVLNTVMTSMLTSVAHLVWETTLFARPGPTLRGDKETRMPRKRSKAVSLPIVEPDAAGIDVGTTQIFVAVPADRDSEPVRCFQTFTVDLHRLAEWLQKCGIRTVAMESTGVYWIPLFQILEQRKIDIRLVNAHHVKNAPGRKTDVADRQWIQHLHACGLLRGSFRPNDEICAIRSVTAIVSLNSRLSTFSTCRKHSTR